MLGGAVGRDREAIGESSDRGAIWEWIGFDGKGPGGIVVDVLEALGDEVIRDGAFGGDCYFGQEGLSGEVGLFGFLLLAHAPDASGVSDEDVDSFIGVFAGGEVLFEAIGFAIGDPGQPEIIGWFGGIGQDLIVDFFSVGGVADAVEEAGGVILCADSIVGFAYGFGELEGLKDERANLRVAGLGE